MNALQERIRGVYDLLDALARGDAIDGAMRAAIEKALIEFVELLIPNQPAPPHRRASVTNVFAVAVMHELVRRHDATQREAARAVLNGKRVEALVKAYQRAKATGKLRSSGVVGPWVEIAVRNLETLRGTEAK